MNERNYLIGAFIVVAALMYASPYVLRLPRTPDQHLKAGLTRIEGHIVADEWVATRTSVQRFEQGWSELRRRMFLHSGPGDVRDFEEALSRLAVAVVEEDRLQARLEVALLKQVLPSLSSY